MDNNGENVSAPAIVPRTKKRLAPQIPSQSVDFATTEQNVASDSVRQTASTVTASNAPVVGTPGKSLAKKGRQHIPIAVMMRSHAREFNQLCQTLQLHWTQMAKLMQFGPDEIANNIPMLATQYDINEAEVLLLIWGDQMNHNITELFVLMARVRLLDAMRIVLHLVPSEYQMQFKRETEELPGMPVDLKPGKRLAQGIRKLNTPLSNEENATLQKPASVPSTNDNHRSASGAEMLDRLASHIPIIPYEELTMATRNWSASNVLGSGGFGTVFHGRWKHTDVAIKRVKTADVSAKANKLEQQQGLNELRHLNSCRHDNILPLYGFSQGPNGEPCLVYKLMTGGSLEYRLSRKSSMPPLMWSDRMRIAIGTARGLQYLHTLNRQPIIHGDIKPANILLDERCEPKIGDFGLTRVGDFDDADVTVSRVFGTRPYLPFDFLSLKTLSTKVDTHSFGVVLLELATGLRAHHVTNGYLHEYTRKFDDIAIMSLMPTLPDGNVEHNRFTFRVLIHLGRNCTEKEASKRPEMVYVMTSLEGMAERTNIATTLKTSLG